MITQFLTWRADTARVTPPEQTQLANLLGDTPGLAQALIHTPASAHDPYLDDGPSPPLVIQLYYRDIAELEAASGSGGALQALATAVPSLAGAEVTEQAMLARSFPATGPAPAEPACTYLVTYTGQAEDLNAWHSYYIAHHPVIMRRFPDIRQIEICTRIDWCSALPFRRVEYMQRNKNVFDSPAALDAALNSPVRHEMRADFHKFPPYDGGNTHYPMITRTVMPRRR